MQKHYAEREQTYGGASVILSKRLSLSAATQRVQAGLLIAQRDTEQRFAPLYESLWIGERYRYSLYQGDIAYLKQTLSFDALTPVSVMAQYSRKITGNTQDELDIGLRINFNDTYRFSVTYSVLNLAGDYEMIHQMQFHTRLNF